MATTGRTNKQLGLRRRLGSFESRTPERVREFESNVDESIREVEKTTQGELEALDARLKALEP